jgi:hypothetical protein
MSAVLPRYTPMAPTLVSEPFHRDDRVYEKKIDGWRSLAYKDRDRVRLLSRSGVDHARRFPDVAAAIAGLTVATLVMDDESAIFDDQLRSRFDWLRRIQRPWPPRRSTSHSTWCFATAGILPGYRYPLGESISRTSLTALTLCFPRGAWPRMASMLGRKSSGTATKGTGRRGRKASIVAAPRERGSR